MYSPLLGRRELLLVDNRGTGRSALIDCRAVAAFTGGTSGPRFAARVAPCARRIECRYPGVHAADLFATAYAVDDLAAVLRALRLGRVDLYGDSYGTWFAQSFMARHPGQLHSVALDSAYPVVVLTPGTRRPAPWRAPRSTSCARATRPARPQRATPRAAGGLRDAARGADHRPDARRRRHGARARVTARTSSTSCRTPRPTR